MKTTVKWFFMSGCIISDKGAESLARVLAVNSSLKYLDLSFTNISHTGAAHISTALRINNSLEFFRVGGDTTTDAAVLSLADALKTNTSLKDMTLQWPSTRPDYTLKSMVEIIKETNLKRIFCSMNDKALAVSSEEEAKEWLQFVEVYRRKGVYIINDKQSSS